MSKSVQALSVAALQERREDAADRLVDLQFTVSELVLGPDGQPAKDQSGARPIVTVGGQWDRHERRFTDAEATTEVCVGIHRGQRHVFEWLHAWLLAYLVTGWPPEEIRPYAAIWVSGRRAGKSWLGVLAALLFAAARPHSIVWLCAPTESKTEELRRLLGGDGSPDELLPSTWGRYKIDDRRFVLANGSQIIMKSGHKSIKEGRADLVVLNEGQLMVEKRYQEARGAIVDTGGLVIVTANPPDTIKGEWIERTAFEVEEGRQRHTVFHRFDAKLNPFIDQAALQSLAETMDDVTADREIGGIFRPIGNVVYHAFTFKRNAQRPTGPRWADVTREHTRALFGRSYDVVVGIDFDKLPHLAAAAIRVYADAEHPSIRVAWVVEECFVPESDEHGLIVALEALEDPRDPSSRLVTPAGAILIPDATGNNQDVKRTTHGDSWSYLVNAGYRCEYPHPDQLTNPRVTDRNKVVNAALHAKGKAGGRGVTRLYLDPRCRRMIECLRKWEIKNGAPFMKSKYAHGCAATGYAVYRLLFDQLKPGASGGAGYIGRPRSRAERALRRSGLT